MNISDKLMERYGKSHLSYSSLKQALGDKIKLIHYGDSSMGHNYSKEARKSFKARHAKNIQKGKMSAAYWADKKLWAGKGKSKKAPPKSQKHTKGIRRA